MRKAHGKPKAGFPQAYTQSRATPGKRWKARFPHPRLVFFFDQGFIEKQKRQKPHKRGRLAIPPHLPVCIAVMQAKPTHT
jgi:hypothetical protein